LIADAALCLSDKPFPSTFASENLDLSITRVRNQTELFLLGFGCRDEKDIYNPAKSGQLYGGLSSVSRLPATPDGHYETIGGVVVCPGDSGGSAYVLGKSDSPGGPRSIVGINSGYFPITRVSAITGLSGIMADFIRDWATDSMTVICGLHQAAKNCRNRFIP